MEQENRDRDRGQTIFLSVVGIATLLVAIIGATFAWFSATVTGNDEASSVIVETATLGITYENGNEINLSNAVPGATDTKTFTVKADNNITVDQSYTLNWNVSTNTFVDKTDLVYTLTGLVSESSQSAATTALVTKTNEQLPGTTGKTAIGTASIKPGETHTYSLTVTFKETSSNQNSNQGKKFEGKIEVESGQVGGN